MDLVKHVYFEIWTDPHISAGRSLKIEVWGSKDWQGLQIEIRSSLEAVAGANITELASADLGLSTDSSISRLDALL